MSLLAWIKTIIAVMAVLMLAYFITIKHPLKEQLSTAQKVRTFIVGIIANFFDTFGIGSFATIVAFRNKLKLMPNQVRFVGSLPIQCVLPTALQSLIFLHYVDVDLLTLVIACVAISLGGLISAFVAIRVSKRFIQIVMFCAFIGTGLAVLATQLGYLNLSGTAYGLSGAKLIFFASLMFISGMLPAFGVGYYSLVQIIIFMLGINPIVAFPLMATASAMQMPITTIPFLFKRKFYYSSALILTIAGAIGVIIAAPLVAQVNSYYLKWFLFAVIGYNIIMLFKQLKNHQ